MFSSPSRERYGENPRPLLTSYLDEGCALLVGYQWYAPATGEAGAHAVVIEGHDSRGYLVLDGEDPRPRTLELRLTRPTPEDTRTWEEARAREPHGARCVLPFHGVWQPPEKPYGLGTHFIVMYPPEHATSRRGR